MIHIEDLIDEPFGAAALQQLIARPGVLQRGRVYRPVDIAQALRAEFGVLGGRTTKEAVLVAFKGYLKGKRSAFSKIGRGRYRFLGPDGQGAAAAEAVPDAELELGGGLCQVYAWYLPHYRRVSPERWPVQIGWAGPDGLDLPVDELPETPCVLLRLRCADEELAAKRAMLIQAHLESRGRAVPDLPSSHWFETNRDELEQVARAILPPDDLRQ